MDLGFVWSSPDGSFRSLILCFQLLNAISRENIVLEFVSLEFSKKLIFRYYAKPNCLNRSLPEASFFFDDVRSFFIFGTVLY